MRRLLPMLVIAYHLLGVASLGRAADAPTPPTGTWKITLSLDRQPVIILISLSQAEGKWVGDYIDATARFQAEPKFREVRVEGDHVAFDLVIGKEPFLSFDGTVAKDGKKLSGSLSREGGSLELVELRPTLLKKVTDGYELTRELLMQSDEPQSVYDASLLILGQAAAKKLKPDDARTIVDRVAKLTASYGPRWERTSALKMAEVLAGQPGFEDVALAQARKAERLLTEQDDVGTRLLVLDALSRILIAAKKPDEAKTYTTQFQKLEIRDFLEYQKKTLSFPIEEFTTRKAKSERVAVVEFFSSTELPPAAGFDLARDALLKSFKPTDALFATYHINLQGAPDQLTSTDNTERVKYYQTHVQKGTLAFVNGKPAVKISEMTTEASAPEIAKAIRQKIVEELEKPATVTLALSSTADEKGISAKATVTDLATPGEQMMLRFVLVEDRIRFTGGNGLRYHQQTVRSLPGGGKGTPLLKATAEETVVIKLEELRSSIRKYLTEVLPGNDAAPAQLLTLKRLKLIAFVQNDTTNEILNAVQIELPVK